MKKAFVVIVLLVVFGAVLFLPRIRFHLIRKDGGGGVLLWKEDEAYLFMFDHLLGYYMSGAELLTAPINSYLHSVPIPSDDRRELTIIHITQSTIERHIQRSTIGIDSFTPIGGAIYATCPGGICKWNGVRFELVSSEEEQGIGGRSRLVNDWNDFTGADGWSKRSIHAVGPGGAPVRGQYSIDVSKQLVLLVTEGNPTFVHIQRASESKEQLWYYKRGLTVVGGARYNSTFAPSTE